ncbi:protein kinase [Desulfurobacterium atlanticum]|uniref:Putative serine/threonine protein kinase n=1 Tax=Desulfurobacterium atlanticum TaxID=240169 RepID=A0A238XTG1_9BACT|nr:protein kinase [Desulfurobacterium atlanticum]SNR61801.1 putative serine/threonine protein kinase [Desulfurobacterium atlanticum]
MKFLTSQPLLAVDYPAGREDIVKKRIEKLERYGISLEKFIAKGYRGTVFSGKMFPPSYFSTPIKVAVKFARSDVDKVNFLLKEAEILEYLSNNDFVPAVYFYDKDFLVMEFVDGEPFDSKTFLHRKDFKEIVSVILEKCYLMDELGVEHTELKGKDHIVVNRFSVKFIDFESAKFAKSPRNLFQFLGAHLFNLPDDALERKGINVERVKKGMKTYKENREKGLKEVLEGLNL